MKWRRINRILHRDLGYFFVGMSIIYGVSGIVLNHRHGQYDASQIRRIHHFNVNAPVKKESIDKVFITNLLIILDEKDYKQYYFPSEKELMIYLTGGHISLNLENGKGTLIKIRNRPVLTEFNFLHYNKPKKLWTWFSDFFAVSMILIAITGLFIIKGKKGITGRGAVLTLAGILIPLVFLAVYVWF
jgi:hypothetical protein